MIQRRLVFDDEYNGRIQPGRVARKSARAIDGDGWDSGDRHCWLSIPIDDDVWYIDPALDQFNDEYRASDRHTNVSVSFGARASDLPSVAVVGPDHEWRDRYVRR